MKKKNAKRPRKRLMRRPRRPTMVKWKLNTAMIEERREALDLTMERAAEAVGMSSRQDWYRMESGRRETVSLATLVAVSRLLRCKVDDLLKYER